MTTTTVADGVATSRRRETTRRRLLDAAAQLSAEVGLDAASVEAICERAGFTRGAFYSNFDSKDRLFIELAGQVARERLEAVRRRIAELSSGGAMTDVPANVFAIVQDVLDVSADDRLGILLRSEIRIHALRSPELAAAYIAQDDELRRSVSQIIADISRTAGVRFRLPPEQTAALLLTVWEGASVRAAIADRDDAAMRRSTNEELARVAQLLLEPSS